MHGETIKKYIFVYFNLCSKLRLLKWQLISDNYWSWYSWTLCHGSSNQTPWSHYDIDWVGGYTLYLPLCTKLMNTSDAYTKTSNKIARHMTWLQQVKNSQSGDDINWVRRNAYLSITVLKQMPSNKKWRRKQPRNSITRL